LVALDKRVLQKTCLLSLSWRNDSSNHYKNTGLNQKIQVFMQVEEIDSGFVEAACEFVYGLPRSTHYFHNYPDAHEIIAIFSITKPNSAVSGLWNKFEKDLGECMDCVVAYHSSKN
jgi:hypothetical protein